MKKKAPCGNTARPDLPWCCHRRLGEWLPQLSLQPSADGRSVCFQVLLMHRSLLMKHLLSLAEVFLFWFFICFLCFFVVFY